MSDFSQSPLEVLAASLARGYTGLHVEQGVPVLDRDLNLLQDLLAEGVRAVLARFVGDGVPDAAGAFGIGPASPPSADLTVGGPGSLLLQGLELRNPRSDLTYLTQAAALGGPAVPPLTIPAAAPRVDTVYLDAWPAEVDDTTDPGLGNPQDVGMRTSVRLTRVWRVRVAEGAPVPAPAAGHALYPLAELHRPTGAATITEDMIVDLRQTRLTVSAMEQRLALMERILLLPAFVPAGGPVPQFQPQSGRVGDNVTVNGSNLDVGALAVFFGPTRAQLVGAPTANQVVARVPGGLTPTGQRTPVRLTLRNQGGQVISDDRFLAQPDPVFADRGDQFTPKRGVPGAPVTLSGFNFAVGTVKVAFVAGGQAVPAVLVGAPAPDRVTVQVPGGLVPAGALFFDTKISITTGAGTDVSDDTFRAELTVPAPTLSGSPQFLPQTGSPSANPPVTVTITGANLNIPPVTVRFDPNGQNLPATIVGQASASQIAVLVPPALSVQNPLRGVPITVTTGGGPVTSTDIFVAR